MIMFLGEFFCWAFYFGKRQFFKGNEAEMEALVTTKRRPTNINPMLLAIPATCDFMASTLMFVALTMVPASVYQMMRGIIVVITAMLAMIFLGRKQYRHHWTGIILIVGGVFIVGLVAVKGGSSSEGTTTGSELFGIILLLIS